MTADRAASNRAAPRGTLLALAGAALLALAGQPGAQPSEPGRVLDPSINAYYYGADFERWRETFESSGREVFDQRFQIVHALGLEPGMAVADVGAGTGLFTLLFARAVGPAGRVYAVDISESFITAIDARAAEVGVDNIVPIVNDPRSSALPPASVDLVFLADTYHHFEFPQAMLASIHAALRPDGVLAIIDFHRIPGLSSPWIMGHVRAGQDQVVAEVEAAGFALIDEPLALKTNYFVRFRRLAPATGDATGTPSGPDPAASETLPGPEQ